jgi:alpha-methylacyl-CoA racemase
VAEIIRRQPREHWQQIFEGTDACFSAVLSHDEVPLHPHHIERGSFVEIAGELQAAPAPRFSRTSSADPTPSRLPGQDSQSILAEFGFDELEARHLINSGSVLTHSYVTSDK